MDAIGFVPSALAITSRNRAAKGLAIHSGPSAGTYEFVCFFRIKAIEKPVIKGANQIDNQVKLNNIYLIQSS